VPYQVFMTCFDKLFKEPSRGEPLPPSEELKQYFRAVCMAVDLGITDPEGRGPDRIREFYERIYPVWKEGLPQADFQTYQEILDGKLRQRLEQERREQQMREAEQARQRREQELAARSREDAHAIFERLTRVALHEAEAEPETDETAAPAAVQPTPERRTVEELANAIAEGQIPISYSDPQSKKPFAHYFFRDQTVTVQVVRTRRTHCLALRYPKGFSKQVGAGVIVKNMLESWGYRERKPFSYFKEQYFFTIRVRVGATSTNVVQQRHPPFTSHALAQALRALHAELARVVQALEDTWPERAEESEGEEASG